MPNNVLMIPFHVDAIFLDKPRLVVEGKTDFNLLPFYDGNNKRDINTDITNLSENILSDPFANQNLTLNPGVHLQFSLPKGLTHGIEDKDGRINYPFSPNRFLVTRKKGNKTDKQWIVESDYLHPEGEDNKYNSICFPVDLDGNFKPENTQFQPYRFMGRQLSLAEYQDSDDASQYLEQLTVLGYGEPTFAAFYPNSYSVFGFCDIDITDQADLKNSNIEYEVIGFYSEQKLDSLKSLVDSLSGKDMQEIKDQIAKQFFWKADSDNLPESAIYYGTITFNADDKIDNINENKPIEVAIGNTSSEALATYLSNNINQTDVAQAEEQLESMQLLTKILGKQIDIGAKFRQARHEKEFTASDGGNIWRVVFENSENDAQKMDQTVSTQATLPQEMAHLLNELNILQQQYDITIDEITTLREQLFSDWCKYMICSYPPAGNKDDYPDIDRVKFFIERSAITKLYEKIKETDITLVNVIPQECKDYLDKLLSEFSDFKDQDTIKDLLDAKYSQLNDCVVKANANVEEGSSKKYSIKNVSAPRYWLPNDPALLLVGDAVTPSDKFDSQSSNYQYADNSEEEGSVKLLDCAMISLNDYPTKSNLGNLYATISAKISDLAPKDTISKEGFQIWKNQSWHPFMLEWQVEVFPLQRNENSHLFRESFITDNYDLKENARDLSAKAETFVKGANIYNGSTILTPFSKTKFLSDVKSYLASSSKDDPAYQVVMDAKEKLEKIPVLSQAMGGFNSALLMKRVAMQLPISDPFAFEDYKIFTKTIKNLVGDSSKLSPLSLNNFNPIRSGGLKILNLHLVDSFGRVRNLKAEKENIYASETLKTTNENFDGILKPRIAQAGRLEFRFLSASYGLEQINTHTATTPICGWLLANNLNNSLMVYDSEGELLGYIDKNANWCQAPGSSNYVNVEDIANGHLQKVVAKIIASGNSYLQDFITVLDKAFENIEPENFAQNITLSILMGNPIAVIRTSLNLTVKGNYAINQDWNVFRNDMQNDDRDSNKFEDVNFPIRIGERRQLNDGVVGYWKEDEDADLADDFYTTVSSDYMSSRVKSENIKAHEEDLCYQSIAKDPEIMTMLVDVKGKFHATCGIFPEKEIDIPADQYANALEKINITFMSSPIITGQDKLSIPIPEEAGYNWSWLEKEGNVWHEIASIGIIRQDKILKEFPDLGDQIWQDLIEQGWIKTIEGSQARATITPKDQREGENLDQSFYQYLEKIELILAQGHINKTSAKAGFYSESEIKEGWLKLNKV